MEMEGATFIIETKMLDDSNPQQVPAPSDEDFQHLHSCGGFSGCYTTCIDTTKEHLIAERKLSRQFIALTAIVPGIEKMDETAVLEDTIEYLKQLQEKVKTLEEQISMNTMTSVVFDKKFQNNSDSGSCSTDENFIDEPQPLPQIEARVSDSNVLIRIHCELCKGVLVKALEETEKLNLCVVNSSAIPFGDSTLEITIMAQMDDGSILTVEDLEKSLRSSLIQFHGNEPSARA